MIILVDLKFEGPGNISFDLEKNGVRVSSPGLVTAGYDLRFVYLPAGKAYATRRDVPVIVNPLHGQLKIPELGVRHVQKYPKDIMIQALTGSLVFLCYDLDPSTTVVKDELSGLELKWIEPAPGCYRTDPKISIGGYQVNLWYLVPGKNGGVHNHADEDRHGSSGMVEFHTQLRGNGRMEKYRGPNVETLCESITMHIGGSHDLFCTVDSKGRVEYPWHAYVAGSKGALFVAFEDRVFDDLKTSKPSR